VAEVRIGTPRRRTKITPEGEFVEIYEIEFFIEDARYSLEFPVFDFDPEKAEAKIIEEAKKLLRLKGKRLPLE